MGNMDGELETALAQLDDAGLRRREPQVEASDGATIQFAGKSLLCMSSNNYLGLAHDPRLADAVHKAQQDNGAAVGAGASRLISGSHRVHRDLEACIADYVQTSETVLFSSGYAANVGTISALVGKGDLVVSDALNHASIIDGCKLSGATVRVFDHSDPASADALLAEHRNQAGRALLITDAVFSMEGDRAPLRELHRVCERHDAWLMVDEAHSFGVYGDEGRGLCHAESVRPEILMGTFGKAFGGAGAFVAGSSALCDWLRNRARSYVFSTAPSFANVTAARAAIDLVRDADARRKTLLSHASQLRSGLRAKGLRVPGDTHIVPVIIGDPAAAMQLSQHLFAHGVFAHGIRPPTVPPGTSRIRFSPVATQRPADMQTVIDAFDQTDGVGVSSAIVSHEGSAA